MRPRARSLLPFALLSSLGACSGPTKRATPERQPANEPEPTGAAGEPAWPELDESFIEASAATLGFRLGKPLPLAITPDRGVLFRRTGARDRRSDLYSLDATGTVATLATVEQLLAGDSEKLSAAERARRERTRTATSGIVDADLSDDGQRVLLAVGERVFVLERASGEAREIALGEGSAFDPHLSPDGTKVSFVRDGDLWLADVGAGVGTGVGTASAKPRRLTRRPAELEYAVAEFVAQEELGRQRGYLWSPDSRWLVFQRTDARKVDTLYVADASHPERAPEPFKYPRAGTENAVVDLGIVAASGGTPRWLSWDLARYPYLAQLQWPEHGPLCLTVLNRAQTELALLAVDPQTGASRELLRAQDSAWLDVPVGSPTWLEDGSGFLWLREEETGFVLELRDASGAVKRVVQPASFGARAIAGVEPDGAAAIVLASRDPREQHVWRVPLDGAPPQALTSGGGVHHALSDHGAVVISSSLREGGYSVTLIAADGQPHPLPSVAEPPPIDPTTELGKVEIEGRVHYTAVTRPRRFEPGRRYPVLLEVYGGPGVKMVQDSRDSYLLDQWYADAGFIVVRADGRGSPHRGRSWERAILRDLLTVPLADQVAVLEALGKRHPELDRSRVGVFGWSFGGYLATLALLLHPEVFHAAIAGAPVTDWALYDTAYTERYMQLPAQNPNGYRHASALTHAAKLRRPLLLMHGTTDDNVHFAHTLALIEALYRAGKRAELVALPSTHMLTDPKLMLAREKLQVEFFREKLGLFGAR